MSLFYIPKHYSLNNSIKIINQSLSLNSQSFSNELKMDGRLIPSNLLDFALLYIEKLLTSNNSMSKETRSRESIWERF